MNIILLHGWMQNKKDWDELKKQLETLPKIKSVIALDLPGFGNEPKVSKDWGIPEYAEWVTNEITKRKLKGVVLFGHSFGGRVSALIASARPTWLAGLVLSGTPTLYRPSIKTQLKTRTFKLLKQLSNEKVREMFYSPELKDAQKKTMDTTFKKAVTFDQTQSIKKIKVPTLLIWGGNDESVPLSIAHETNQLISNSKLFIIPNAKHNAFASHGLLFFGYVKKFLETI